MRFQNKVVATSESLAADYTSKPISLQHTENFVIHAKWSGSPVGVMYLQGALRDDGDTTDWFDLPEPIDVSAAGNWAWSFVNAPYPLVRFFFDWTSGTGTLTRLEMGWKGE